MRNCLCLAITGTVLFPQAIGEQHLCSYDFKAEASSFPGQELHQAIEALGVSSGVAISKVVEYRIPIVLDCHCQRQEAIVVIEGDLLKPSKVAFQAHLFGFCLIDFVKGFFEAIGNFQLGEVLKPCFNDELFAFIEVMSAAQKQILIVHQRSSSLVCQALTHSPTDMFQATGEQFQNVKLVYYQMSLGQDLAYCFMVARPHIGANDHNLLFHLIGQFLQVLDDGCFLAVSKKINNMMALYVTDDATVLIQQVQFVNTEVELLGVWNAGFDLGGEFAEQNADQLFIDSHIRSQACEGLVQRLGSDVVDQALRHEVVFIHMWDWLEEGTATFTTSVAFTLNDDPNAFSSDWGIHVKLGLCFMLVQLGVSAMSTTRWQRDTLRLNVKIVFILIYGNDAIVCQSKDIQEMRSLPDVLPHEFLSSAEIPVTQERRLLRVPYGDSTHFSEVDLLCREGGNRGIPRIFPISQKVKPWPVR